MHDFQTSVRVFPVYFVGSGKCHATQGGGDSEDFSFGIQLILKTFSQHVTNINYLIIFRNVMNNLKGIQLCNHIEKNTGFCCFGV